jgi:hypothetical protein
MPKKAKAVYALHRLRPYRRPLHLPRLLRLEETNVVSTRVVVTGELEPTTGIANASVAATDVIAIIIAKAGATLVALDTVSALDKVLKTTPMVVVA